MSVVNAEGVVLASLVLTLGKLNDVKLVVDGLPGLEFTTKDPSTIAYN